MRRIAECALFFLALPFVLRLVIPPLARLFTSYRVCSSGDASDIRLPMRLFFLFCFFLLALPYSVWRVCSFFNGAEFSHRACPRLIGRSIDLVIDAVATLARRLIGPLFDVFTGRAIDAWLDSYIGSLIYRLIHLSPRRFLRCAVNW